MRCAAMLLLLSAISGESVAAQIASLAITDPAPDREHPAAQDAFVLPEKKGAMNALIYLASGAGPHPTLVLLHGFPGNEQSAVGEGRGRQE